MLRHLDRDAPSIAALEDALRRRMYLFVRGLGRPASREEVAAEAGISRKLAAFHLDKLADRGLLVTSYARPAGRSGRGAGRTAKYYEPSDRQVDVSIPERRYDVIGSILVGAIAGHEPGEPPAVTARRVAHDTGKRLGHDERERRRLPPPGAERTMSVLTDVLARCGYEPAIDEDGTMQLRSCPFHQLAEQERDLVCGLNRVLLAGVVEGLGSRSVEAELAPQQGRCCVRLRPRGGGA